MYKSKTKVDDFGQRVICCDSFAVLILAERSYAPIQRHSFRRSRRSRVESRGVRRTWCTYSRKHEEIEISRSFETPIGFTITLHRARVQGAAFCVRKLSFLNRFYFGAVCELLYFSLSRALLFSSFSSKIQMDF